MADEPRPSVENIAAVQRLTAISQAEKKRAAGKTKGKHITAKQAAADAKVSFLYFPPSRDQK